jgi:hypothetical protein
MANGLAVTPDSATERAILRARDAMWHAWFADGTAQLSQLLPEAVAAGGDAESGQRWTDRRPTEVFVLRNGRWANPFWHLGHRVLMQ